MQPSTNVNTTVGTTTPANQSFDQQLADIKAQASKIVTAARKVDPNIKISTANAEMIGMPKVDIPTTKKETPRPTALDTVGTTPKPQTSMQVAREALLSGVKEEDRDMISQILDVSTGLQTERGAQYESTMDSMLTQQLSNIQSTRDRALETSNLKEAQRIPELEAELESIRGEADVLDARRNSAIQAEERREGVSTSARTGNVARIDRDFNLEKANLAIRELASVGKINAATKLIDTKLDLKYGDLEAETELLTAQVNAIKPFLDREDAKAADMRLQLNEVVKGKLADARAEDRALEEFKLQSYMFAQQNGATPAVLSAIMSSDNRGDVASVGGSYIQDPMQKLQMEQTRQSIETEKAQRANIYDQIASRAEQNKAIFGTLNGKQQTETERLTEGYANRMAESDAIINQVGSQFAKPEALIWQVTPNLLKSEDRQKFEQAQRNFINAVLRRESGAVISPEEFTNAKLQYFPQPGDSQGVLTQKAINRQSVIGGMYNTANVPMPEYTAETNDTTPLAPGSTGVTKSGITFTIE